MKEKLNKIKNSVLNELERTQTLEQLESLHQKYFSRKSGDFSQLMKDLKDVKDEYRPVVGRLANQAKREVEAAFNEVKNSLKNEDRKSVV